MGYGDALVTRCTSTDHSADRDIRYVFRLIGGTTLWWDVRVGLWFRGFLLRAARHWVHRLAGHGRLRAAVAACVPATAPTGGYRRRLCRPGGGLPCGGASGAHRRLRRDPRGADAATPLWPRHRQEISDPAY